MVPQILRSTERAGAILEPGPGTSNFIYVLSSSGQPFKVGRIFGTLFGSRGSVASEKIGHSVVDEDSATVTLEVPDVSLESVPCMELSVAIFGVHGVAGAVDVDNVAKLERAGILTKEVAYSVETMNESFARRRQQQEAKLDSVPDAQKLRDAVREEFTGRVAAIGADGRCIKVIGDGKSVYFSLSPRTILSGAPSTRQTKQKRVTISYDVKSGEALAIRVDNL